MRILALDPGYDRLGIAVLEENENLIFSECFETSKKDSHEKRLLDVGNRLEEVIKKYSPTCCAVEELFFSKNQKTAMKVAEVRGVIIFQAIRFNLPVHEYKPVEIKVAVTGHGGSDKKQVIHMVKTLLKLKEDKKHDDEYDAIATGITHLASYKLKKLST